MGFNYDDEDFLRTLTTQRHLHHVSELATKCVRLLAWCRDEQEKRHAAEAARVEARSMAATLLNVCREVRDLDDHLGILPMSDTRRRLDAAIEQAEAPTEAD
jgi:hypothetical protein